MADGDHGSRQAQAKPAAPTLTFARQNARGTAEDYLDMSGEQLEFEGFTRKQAAYGVKSVGL